MIRKIVSVAVLWSLAAAYVEAGLHSALTASLAGLQPAETGTIQLPVGVFQYAREAPIPEGALFLDPVASKRNAGVFRGGPGFYYDPVTGGVTISAPPMLGPADEFGIRQQYSPRTITAVGSVYFADEPTIPHAIKYRRNIQDSLYDLYPSVPPLAEDAPSFVVDETSGSISLYTTPDTIVVGPLYVSGLSGVEVGFSNLLAPGLDAMAFQSDIPVLTNSIWPYLRTDSDALPEVHFVVEYEAEFQVYSLGLPQRYSLLATPLGQANPTSAPEPAGLLLVLSAGGLLIVGRLPPRVA